jgi:hypothetical protein
MKVILVLLTLALSLTANAEITDRKFLKKYFDGCMTVKPEIFTPGEEFFLCGCSTYELGKQFNKKQAKKLNTSKDPKWDKVMELCLSYMGY